MNRERVVRKKELLQSDISALIKDEILLLVIESYLPKEHCEHISQNLLQSSRKEAYTHDYMDQGKKVQKYFGVDRIGIPFNSTYSKEPDAIDRYYDSIREYIDHINKLSKPFSSPIDKFKKDLSLFENYTCNIASFENKEMLAGIIRITQPEYSYLSAEQPHFDALPSEYGELEKQLAANIYLKTPKQGGYLEIWDIPPLASDFEAPRDWRCQLPESYKLQPKDGDLVLFNCRKPHAIGEFKGEPRLSVQVFMGVQDTNQILLWN